MRSGSSLHSDLGRFGQQFCFVANTDLAHLDPRLKLFRQIAHELAKIDTTIGQKINNHSFATEHALDVGYAENDVVEASQLAIAPLRLAAMRIRRASMKRTFRDSVGFTMPTTAVSSTCS